MGISYHFVLLYYHPKPFIIRNKYANIPANPVFDLIFLVRNQIDLTVPFRAHEYENSLKSRVFQNHNHKTFLYSVSLHVDLQNTMTSVFCVSNNCSKLVHCNPSSPSDSMNFFSLSNSRNFSFLSRSPTGNLFFFPTSVFFLSPILENTPKLFHSNPRV